MNDSAVPRGCSLQYIYIYIYEIFDRNTFHITNSISYYIALLQYWASGIEGNINYLQKFVIGEITSIHLVSCHQQLLHIIPKLKYKWLQDLKTHTERHRKRIMELKQILTNPFWRISLIVRMLDVLNCI